MSPTIVVREGQPVLVVGGVGASRISTGVLQLIVNFVDFGMTGKDIRHAIDEERMDAVAIDDSSTPEVELAIEDKRVDPNVIDELTSRGHKVRSRRALQSVDDYDLDGLPVIEVAGIDLATGRRYAAMDPRHSRNLLGQDEERGAAGQWWAMNP